MAGTLLEMRGIGKTFPGVRALDRVNLTVEEGEIHVFDVKSGKFVPASDAEHSGTGPYHDMDVDSSSIFNEVDSSWYPPC